MPVIAFDVRFTPARRSFDPQRIGRLAASALTSELNTWPKPGLVSHVDAGSHRDMDAIVFERGIAAIEPYFVELSVAGYCEAPMDRLRAIGRSAEDAMTAATRGINTHRGAIFGLGLLCAAMGLATREALPLRSGVLGRCVRRRWGDSIRRGPIPFDSHGTVAVRRFGVGGARAQGAAGFPTAYAVGLDALRRGRDLAPADPEAARVQAFFAILAKLDDTNVLYRGGRDGLLHAQRQAAAFLARGGVGRRDWRREASAIHADFASRNLSPGGCADLLSMTLFIDTVEGGA